MKTALLSTLALALITPLAAQARTHYWVDAANGADTNAGTKAAPFKTLAFAIGAKQSDTVVHVLPGTYGPATTGDFWDASATPPVAAPIRLTGYTNFKICGTDRDTCIIDLAGNTGVWFGYLNIGNNCDNVEVCNLSFKNAGTAPWGNSPLNINGTAKDVNVHSNSFVDCNSAFINWGGLDCSFHDNVIDSTTPGTGYAIRVRTHQYSTTNRDRMYVYNNLIMNQAGAIGSEGKVTSQHWIVNNIALNCTTGFAGGVPHTNMTHENNNAFNCTTPYSFAQPASNLTVDPEFVDPTNGDFRIKPTSPCVDAGWQGFLRHEVNDYFGGARGYDYNNDGLAQLDIGAHELSDVSLTLVKDFEQGKTPEFSFSSTKATIPLGFFVLAYGKSGSASFPLYHVEPFGTLGVDPNTILLQQLTAIPTGAGWSPIGAIPVLPVLDGVEIYFQGMAFETTANGDRFKPTGLLTLNL